METPGIRVYKDDESKVIDLKPYEYMLSKDGRVFFVCPNPVHPVLCCIDSTWKIIENPDKTITVTPSILIKGGPDMGPVWHGYLTNGVWVEC